MPRETTRGRGIALESGRHQPRAGIGRRRKIIAPLGDVAPIADSVDEIERQRSPDELKWRLYHYYKYNRFVPVNRLTAFNRLYRIRERLPRQCMATCGW